MAVAEQLDEPEDSFIVPVASCDVADCEGSGIECLDATGFDIVAVRDLNAEQSDRIWRDRHKGESAEGTFLALANAGPESETAPEDSVHASAEGLGGPRQRLTRAGRSSLIRTAARPVGT